MIFLATAATYIIPAGEFTRYEDPVSGETLVQAGSYVSTGTNPANPLHMPMLMYDGILDAADVIAFLLIIGGSFELVNASGAILALCRTVGRKLRGKEIFVVPIFLALFAVFGTTMGMSNEVAIFVPIGITMALTLGFARAIMLTLENAMVIDTIANAVSIAVNALPAAVQSIGFFLAQTGVSFVITSGSGMAAVTIPLMAPVADLIGAEPPGPGSCLPDGRRFLQPDVAYHLQPAGSFGRIQDPLCEMGEIHVPAVLDLDGAGRCDDGAGRSGWVLNWVLRKGETI